MDEEFERLSARGFARLLTTIKPICTCCEVCADKASDEIMAALDARGWFIANVHHNDGDA